LVREAEGNGGDDYLEGGAGKDTYYAGDKDDSNGQGVVLFEGKHLTGGTYNEEKGIYKGDG
jgi:hypothetical protein